MRAWHDACMNEQTQRSSGVSRRWITTDGLCRSWKRIVRSQTGHLQQGLLALSGFSVRKTRFTSSSTGNTRRRMWISSIEIGPESLDSICATGKCGALPLAACGTLWVLCEDIVHVEERIWVWWCMEIPYSTSSACYSSVTPANDYSVPAVWHISITEYAVIAFLRFPSAAHNIVVDFACLDLRMAGNVSTALVHLLSGACRDVEDISFLAIIWGYTVGFVASLSTCILSSEVDWAWTKPAQRSYTYRSPARYVYYVLEWSISTTARESDGVPILGSNLKSVFVRIGVLIVIFYLAMPIFCGTIRVATLSTTFHQLHSKMVWLALLRTMTTGTWEISLRQRMPTCV